MVEWVWGIVKVEEARGMDGWYGQGLHAPQCSSLSGLCILKIRIIFGGVHCGRMHRLQH